MAWSSPIRRLQAVRTAARPPPQTTRSIPEPASGDAATYYKDIDPGYEGTNLYFKAGVYNQNNTGDVSDYVQATFFILEHTH